MRLNWERGFRRVTLLASAAVCAGVFAARFMTLEAERQARLDACVKSASLKAKLNAFADSPLDGLKAMAGFAPSPEQAQAAAAAQESELQRCRDEGSRRRSFEIAAEWAGAAALFPLAAFGIGRWVAKGFVQSA
jgi:hypothetical protein